MVVRQISTGKKCVRNSHVVDGPWAQQRYFPSQRRGCLLHHSDEVRKHSGKNPYFLDLGEKPKFLETPSILSQTAIADGFPFARQQKPLNPKLGLVLWSLKVNTPHNKRRGKVGEMEREGRPESNGVLHNAVRAGSLPLFCTAPSSLCFPQRSLLISPHLCSLLSHHFCLAPCCSTFFSPVPTSVTPANPPSSCSGLAGYEEPAVALHDRQAVGRQRHNGSQSLPCYACNMDFM